MKSKIVLFIVPLFIFGLNTQDVEYTDPVYECNSQELYDFIKVQTTKIRSPSPLPLADEVQAAILEAKSKNEDEEEQACLSVWAASMPEIDFQKKLEQAKDFFAKAKGVNLMTMVIDKAKSAANDILSGLTDSVCEMLDPEIIEQEVARLAYRRTGIDMNNFNSSAKSVLNKYIDDELYKKLGSDSRYVRDPSRISDDARDNAVRDVRRRNRDFWGN